MIARMICAIYSGIHGSSTYRYSEGSAAFLFASLSLESAAKFTKQGYSGTTCILVKKQTNINKKKSSPFQPKVRWSKDKLFTIS